MYDIVIILLLLVYYKIESYRHSLIVAETRLLSLLKKSSSTTWLSSKNLDYDMFIKDRIKFNIDLQYRIKECSVSEADTWLSCIHNRIMKESSVSSLKQLKISCADTINIYIKDAIDNRHDLSRANKIFESYFLSGLGQ